MTTLEPALWPVKADPGQLEQVLMNLVVNARDAMPEGGQLTIATTNVELDESISVAHEPAPIGPGAYVVLAVSDSGIGMDSATQARIFYPFFTTKGRGKGTGLGLSTTYGTVKQSGGFIWVYSEPGLGTTFKIYLPGVQAVVDAPAEIRVSHTPAGGSETILLVEDDETVRAVIRLILQRNGYAVLEAPNGTEALRLCGDASLNIGLLISDLVMPDMRGTELARCVRTRYPELAILLISGYSEDIAGRDGVFEPGTAFLEKPFTPEMLTRMVRDLLGGPLEAVQAG